MNMRIGIVAEVHHTDHSVDLVMADDGSRIVGAQILTPNGSTRSGTVDLPEVKPAGKDKWDVTKRSGQDLRAVVAYISGHPVVMGFLYPQVNQMLVKDGKTARYRHQSDVETLIDGKGNTQVTLPNGTYMRIGDAPDVDKLPGGFVDESSTDRNTGANTYIHVENKPGGAYKGHVQMDPEGNTKAEGVKEVRFKAGTNATTEAGGDAYEEAAGDRRLKSGGNTDVVSGDQFRTRSEGKTQVVAGETILIRSLRGRIILQSATGILVI